MLGGGRVPLPQQYMKTTLAVLRNAQNVPGINPGALCFADKSFITLSSFSNPNHPLKKKNYRAGASSKDWNTYFACRHSWFCHPEHY